eukprot:COSAG02_NODE_9976_length_2059_cov_2.705612_3_plen_77_part_00
MGTTLHLIVHFDPVTLGMKGDEESSRPSDNHIHYFSSSASYHPQHVAGDAPPRSLRTPPSCQYVSNALQQTDLMTD